MSKRFVSVWFHHLTTDWFTNRYPQLQNIPFVLKSASRGRIIITAANLIAEGKGIRRGMMLADARAVVPELHAFDEQEDLALRLLRRLAEWCIRFTPVVAVDFPDGLLFDASGCAHLWRGDELYLAAISQKLGDRGYGTRISIAGTAGLAWGVARYGHGTLIIDDDHHLDTLLKLPPEALRIAYESTERLHKLGLKRINQFIGMPRSSLLKRFGPPFLHQLDKALGHEIEMIEPVHPVEPYHERLPCMEPIVTATGIEIALRELLKFLCKRLQNDEKGIRKVSFKCYRADGKIVAVEIGTNRPSHHEAHLFKLFESKLSSIEPASGIELFVLEASTVEDCPAQQEKIWKTSGGLEDVRLSELIDRLANRVGMQAIHRYVPDEHYWPERSLKAATSIHEKAETSWRSDQPRPLQLLLQPEPIEVSAPIPDYPPMLFRMKGKVHKVVKADGPERIEQEWWIQQGQHRDYYRVEDEEGKRYWLFRLGHYNDKTFQWFLHGYFA
jgi:protein ImuB